MKDTAPNLAEAVGRFPTLARFRFGLEALDPISLPELLGLTVIRDSPAPLVDGMPPVKKRWR
jgi:hypothetical protein